MKFTRCSALLLLSSLSSGALSAGAGNPSAPPSPLVLVHPSFGDSDFERVFVQENGAYAAAGKRVFGNEPTFYELEVRPGPGQVDVFFETNWGDNTASADVSFRDGECYSKGEEAPWATYPPESVPFPIDFRLAASFILPSRELCERARNESLQPGIRLTAIDVLTRSVVTYQLDQFAKVEWQGSTLWRFALNASNGSDLYLLCADDGHPIRVVHEDFGMNATREGHLHFPPAAVHSTAIDEGPWRDSLSKVRYKTHTLKNVMIPMRDGVHLAANIVLPNTSVPVPTIFIRTPYLRGGELITASDKYPKRGYALVVQDVRGRGDSEGDFVPFLYEKDDASDTLDWIAEQKWSDGGVGMIGSSYVGMVQWFAAASGNPHLKCIIPIVSPPDPDENFPYEGGVLMLLIGWWAAVMDAQDEDGFLAGIPILDWNEVLGTLPLSDLDTAVETEKTFVDEWVAHPPSDHEYWAPRRFHPHIPQIDIPVLNISGWFDGDQPGALLNFQAMRDRGPNGSFDHQYLMMGPWGHAVNLLRRLGDVDFGDKAVINLDAYCLRFFDRYLKDVRNGIDEEDRVLLFTMGENRWRRTTDWPPPDNRPTRIYLHNDGDARMRNGDGRLSTSAPRASSKPDTYRYDPLDTRPLDLDFSDVAGASATADQSKTPDREDVLDFLSPALAEPVTLTGPFTFHLTVSTDAPDTDFAGELFVVDPQGRMRGIAAGIQRLRYRRGAAIDEPVAPNTVVPIVVDGWANSLRIEAGHRLHFQLSSSQFPGMARNLNTLEPASTATRVIIANNTVYHDQTRLSWIEVPVAEGTTLRFE